MALFQLWIKRQHSRFMYMTCIKKSSFVEHGKVTFSSAKDAESEKNFFLWWMMKQGRLMREGMWKCILQLRKIIIVSLHTFFAFVKTWKGSLMALVVRKQIVKFVEASLCNVICQPPSVCFQTSFRLIFNTKNPEKIEKFHHKSKIVVNDEILFYFARMQFLFI